MRTFNNRRMVLAGGGLLLAATATAALAGSGVGGVFNLGQLNSVNATTRLDGTTATRQLWVSNASTAIGSTAVAGIANGGIGVWGQSERRMGVRALTTRTTGVNYGVYATTASADGLAGYFQNTNATDDFQGTALVAVSRGATAVIPNTYADPAGAFVGYNGVLGTTSPGSDNGFGVIGDTAGTFGTGVRAAARSTTGNNYGVWATAASEDGIAGFFQNLHATDGVAVSGVASATSGVGVSGSGDTGVYGYSPDYAGVIGEGPSLAIYSIGNALVEGDLDVDFDLNVLGELTKGSGTFKIDHPLDPANKYLSHSFVESPDMMNIYNGNVVTDAEGIAVVELPDYFEALNRDPRYQLTVIGSPGDAYVSREISDNHFSIQTERPNVKVSWQVTGIRQDAFAAAHPVVVEEDKALADRGHYLHPAELGQPADLAIRRIPPPSQAAGLAPQPAQGG